ncbi:RraA family protein [Variovorax saccharolyticus]|uniref:RraA family protein n=1 Tax=Variovorax saccharolyticus TaxID=3053516 RepID=UPI0025785EC7|nr:RraA family protein [Variovorax sp. J31P216]MDM0028350.1 RraA family protein [Variovorax sp. J31P216]
MSEAKNESAQSDALIDAFKALDTASVSDAMDKLGLEAGCLGIKPVVTGVKFAGRAFTVKYRACGVVERGTVGDFLDDVPTGHVIVIDNGGRIDCTVWGDIMTTLAHRMGVAATVIDGVCRDVPKIRELSYPIFTRDYYMMTGKDRVELEGLNVPVNVANRQVRPGDIVVGDDSGVVVVPASRAAEVLEVARQIEHTEQEILKRIAKGQTLREARSELQYHALQTPSQVKN